MAFKILSKKNGKRTINDDKGNDTIKVTKVLQFLTEVEPKKATIGTIVRFCWISLKFTVKSTKNFRFLVILIRI